MRDDCADRKGEKGALNFVPKNSIPLSAPMKKPSATAAPLAFSLNVTSETIAFSSST